MLFYSDLRETQLDGIYFIETGTSSLVLADVGTGKTVMSLTALYNWLDDNVVNRALILAPKRVATEVWPHESLLWDHLQRRPYRMAVIAGKSEVKRREGIDGHARIVVMNYENLPWLLEAYPECPFDCLIFDEVDKMKDRTTRRFKGRKWFDDKLKLHRQYAGMKTYARQANFVVGLTGTPASNNLLDLWAPMHIVDGGESLGRNYDRFRRAHFYQADYAGRDWQILPGKEKAIYDAIEPVTFRIERDDDMPGIVETPPRIVQLAPDVMKKYKKFQRDLLIRLEKGEKLESPHAAAAYGKCRQIANGFAYRDDRSEDRTVWLDSAKYAELDNLLSELQGQQAMIIYQYQAQLERLKHRYSDLRFLSGGMSDKAAATTIKGWNEGKISKLALQPASAGHGLNLQKSNAHHIIMLTEPESAGLREQVIGRLRRTGNDARTVFVHSILTDKTVDTLQKMKLEGKIETQTEFLAEMKKRCA